MKKQDIWLVFVVLVKFIGLTLQAIPVLSIPSKSSTMILGERSRRKQELMKGITCTDADNDLTRVYLKAISPAQPCGKCFPVWPCGQGYCLMFIPGIGSLPHELPIVYVVTVECTDETSSVTDDIVINLLANRPPQFHSLLATEKVAGTANKRAGDVIYTANATDSDKDTILYTLTTEPPSDFFHIQHGTGRITATKDLRLMCRDSIRLYITANDNYHDPGDTMVVNMQFAGRNFPPVFRKTESVHRVKENTVGRTVVRVRIHDDTLYGDTQWRLRAEPAKGLEYYRLQIQNNKEIAINARKPLNYRNAELRSVTLYIDVTDGFCDAETLAVRMDIDDVNESPGIHPRFIERTVYEGLIKLDTGVTVLDPDEGEKIEWKLTKDGQGAFHVDIDTGTLFSSGNFDVDKPRIRDPIKLEVRATDKVGNTDNAEIRLTILDKNDNAPYFFRRLYPVTATNCTRVGSVLETVKAGDDDSEFQGNNQLVYSGEGGNVTVLSTGDVILNTKCVPGQTETLKAYVTDQGLYPGPLSGVPALVEFTCRVCPKLVATAKGITGGQDDRELDVKTLEDIPNESDFVSYNVSWLVFASLLVSLLVGLLGYFIWKYYMRVRRNGLMLQSGSLNRSRPQKTTALNVVHVKPALQQQTTQGQVSKDGMPESPELPLDGEPVIFGFWKETYPDRDQRHMPTRDSIPASVEQDRKTGEMEKEEEEREKENRRLGRLRVAEGCKKELEKCYNKRHVRKKYCNIA